MSSLHLEEGLARIVRTCQIIIAALLMGAVTITVVMIVLGASEGRRVPPDLPLLTYAAIGLGVVTLAGHVLLPNVFVTGARRRIAQGTWSPPASAAALDVSSTDVGKLLVLYPTKLIIGAALLEGPAFLGAIAYYLEGNVVTLVASGVLIALLALQFPSRGRVEAWLEEQQRLLELDRQTSGGTT